MADQATPEIDGVKLTTVTVNAASPDVVGTLLRQITEAVMKAIPEGTIEKIAAEIIKNGEVIRCSPNSYGRAEEVKYNISDEAKKKLIVLLDKEIERQVWLYFKEQAVQTVLADAICQGVAAGMDYVPRLAAYAVASRVCGVMSMSSGGPADIPPYLIPLMNSIESMRKTQMALNNKGVINAYNGVDA